MRAAQLQKSQKMFNGIFRLRRLSVFISNILFLILFQTRYLFSHTLHMKVKMK